VNKQKDPIKAAGPDRIARAAEKAARQVKATDESIALSVCGALKCQPLSMARKLAIGRFVDACPDCDEQEIAMVSAYVLSLPREDFWMHARNAKALLGKAASFADESDPAEYEELLKEAAIKISHLQESSAMAGDGGGGGEQAGNAGSSRG
jgi:hypothetical protein